MFEKHQYGKDKSQIIATAIKKCYIFYDAEVPLYPTLVRTFVKRDWTASYIRKRASLVNEAIVLSSFVMVDLTEKDVVIMQ